MNSPQNKDVRGATKAFSGFFTNYNQVSAFFNMTQTAWMNPLAFVEQKTLEAKNIQKTEKEQIVPLMIMTRLGKSVAARLLIVYLGTMLETYIRDAIVELIQDKQTNVNFLLMGKPVPTNEDEDINIYVDLKMALEDPNNPVYTLGHLAIEYVNSRLRRDSVREGLRLLETEFNVKIENESTHKQLLGRISKNAESSSSLY